MRISVRCEDSSGPLEHFWEGTAFTPAAALLEADMQQSLRYIGGVPFGGVEYARIHYLLDLVRARDLDTDDPVYDWTDLDAALDVLVDNGVRPIFELMGTPSSLFTDFTTDEQLRAWRRLVRDLAVHLEDRYGREEVEQWLFEAWNEPDRKWERLGFAHNHEAFCHYYDACSIGLRDANEDLVLGGPGTAKTLSPVFKAFVRHCDEGEHYFTGEEGVRLDFLSVHEKSVGIHREDRTLDTDGICDRELAALEYVREHHPDLLPVPYQNNECDPQRGWVDVHSWRGRPTYAGLIARMVEQHADRVVGEVPAYDLVNNHAHLGTWGQRTMFTEFTGFRPDADEAAFTYAMQDRNRDRERSDTFALVKKPSYNAMVLLSLLGDERVAVSGKNQDETVGALATRRGDDQVAVLVSNSSDDTTASGSTRVDLRLADLPFESAALAHYRIDEHHTNPRRVWEEEGAPNVPTREQLEAMWAEHHLQTLEEPSEVATPDGTFETSFDLPLPGVSLVVLSAKPAEPPGRPTDLVVEPYRGLTTVGREVMASWEGPGDRTVRTYEVLYADDPDGPFERLNDHDTVCTAYHHAFDARADPDGYVAVRAVDYWGRAGPRSEPVAVPDETTGAPFEP